MARRKAVTVGDAPATPIRATKKIKAPLPKLEDEAIALMQQVEGITVKTQAECTAAALYAREIRRKRKMWEAHEKPVVIKAKAVYDEARDRYNALDKPMKQAEDSLKLAIGNFKLGARQLAEATIATANETSVALEQERLGDYLQQSEDAREAAMAERQADIDAATNAGDLEKAQQLLQAPLVVDLPTLPAPDLTFGPGEMVAALATEDGISVGEKWDFEILNPNVVPDTFWSVDPKLVGAAVAVSKGATRIPGVRVFVRPRVGIR